MKKTISELTTAIGVTESHQTDFVYPPSVQGDLFNHLKPEQQEKLKPILRIVKRPYASHCSTVSKATASSP